MSNTKQRAERTGSPRRGQTRSGRLPKRRAYVPFTVQATEKGSDVVIAHLNWLVQNMDYFAREGRATLQTATRALHQDLLLARLIEPVQKKNETQQYKALRNIADELAASIQQIKQRLEYVTEHHRDADAKDHWDALWTAIYHGREVCARFYRIV